jgi:hypothetical protein
VAWARAGRALDRVPVDKVPAAAEWDQAGAEWAPAADLLAFKQSCKPAIYCHA